MKKLKKSKVLQAKFQVNFNRLMDKIGTTKKEKVYEEAERFFKFCVRNVEDGGHCPFPEYLAESYLKTV